MCSSLRRLDRGKLRVAALLPLRDDDTLRLRRLVPLRRNDSWHGDVRPDEQKHIRTNAQL